MEHARPARRAADHDRVPDIVPEVLRDSGQPLDQAVTRRAEAELGGDFSRVRVHADDRAAASARAIGATAYTLGRDIVFDAGRYAPGTSAGEDLLRHELTHVQQAPHSATGPLRLGGPGDLAEHQTDLVDAGNVIRRQPTSSEELTPREIMDRFVHSTSTADFTLRLGLGPVRDDVLYAYLRRKGFGPRQDEFKNMPHADVGRPGDEIVGRIVQRESPDGMGFVGTYERGTARELDQRQADANEQTQLMLIANFMTILAGTHIDTITPGPATPELVAEAMPNPRSAAGKRMATMLGPEPGLRPIAGANEVTQARELGVSHPRLLAEYEQLANAKLPNIIRDATEGERSTANRRELTRLRAEFQDLMNQVGGAPTLTARQRVDAERILNKARPLGRAQYANLRTKINQRLRADPQLKEIADRLIRMGDAADDQRGALQVLVNDPRTGATSYEPLNLEHKIRETDNPWATKSPGNLVVSDAPQNQQYLESLRELGSIWPSGDQVEDFVVRHQLNNEDVNFRPGSR
ncbi:MAG TPA: DUF4157 domain-containing protein [Pseudonocardiaceae bacterium]|jgi:hypothetical protein